MITLPIGGFVSFVIGIALLAVVITLGVYRWIERHYK
jgi:hypothetical protein